MRQSEKFHYQKLEVSMKSLVFLLFLLNLPMCYATSCFTDDEYKIILQRLDSFKQGQYQDYGSDDFTNIVDCKNTSILSSLVCSNTKLENAMLLLSKGEIYAYENATRQPLLDLNYNIPFRKRLDGILQKEKDKNVALRKLCYIVKSKLSDDFGGDFSYKPEIHELISTKINKNGVIINSWGGIPETYLGKSCDAMTKDKEKGIWYKDKDQFVIELEKTKYRFNYDEKVFSLDCESPK